MVLESFQQMLLIGDNPMIEKHQHEKFRENTSVAELSDVEVSHVLQAATHEISSPKGQEADLSEKQLVTPIKKSAVLNFEVTQRKG